MKANEIVYTPRFIEKELDKKVYLEYLRETGTVVNEFSLSRELKRKKTKVVRAHVSNLPNGELAVVYLKFWKGLCEEEISKSLSLSLVKVKMLLASALERLKHKLTNDLDFINSIEGNEYISEANVA